MHNKSTPASSSTSSSGGGGGEGQSGAESTSAPVGPSVSKTSSTTGTEKVNRYLLNNVSHSLLKTSSFCVHVYYLFMSHLL